MLCYRDNKRQLEYLKRKIKDLEGLIEELKSKRFYSIWVQFPMFIISLASSLCIWMKFKNGLQKKTDEKSTSTRTLLSDVPGIVYFDVRQLPDIRSLTDSFLDDPTSSTLLITKEKDFSKIYSKLVFIFIESNDRHIILEGENDVGQLKRLTVEAVESDGGMAVVIYQFHADSSHLKEGCLYSEKLSSIQHHPILKKLSQEDCVISVYNNFLSIRSLILKSFTEIMLPPN